MSGLPFLPPQFPDEGAVVVTGQWEIAQGRMPIFLIVMIPVFALVRFGLYFYYSRV